ncbi:MAG: TIGR00730 family Rossman fold protein [Acidobacteria bacterium]|nr:TIGR00730 family Rossman fold protein [Acidobacteriota bacterium]
MFERLCVFCGSSTGRIEAYQEAARATGAALAQRGIELVYGGGRNGLMGILADAALEVGGRVTGVMPGFLIKKEIGHTGVTELIVVASMHERKSRMAGMADGFIALPGGFGTFEEFFEVVTWAQLRLHAKPCGVLNVAGFYDPLLALLDHACAEGLIHPEHRDLVVASSDLDELLEKMSRVRSPGVDKV